MNNFQDQSPEKDALPLSEPTFLILVSLGGTPKHGYAIIKEVASLSGGRVHLSTGTLFGALKRMLGREWIQRVSVTQTTPDGRNRKYYALTRRGRRVLEAETHRLRQLIAIANRQIPSGAQGSVD